MLYYLTILGVWCLWLQGIPPSVVSRCSGLNVSLMVLLSIYKVCLVAKGFHQQEGFGYFETFSPMVKPVIICVIHSIAISKGCSLRQLDVQNAFLNDHLAEEVCMVQPPGFIDKQNPTLVSTPSSPLWFKTKSMCMDSSPLFSIV